MCLHLLVVPAKPSEPVKVLTIWLLLSPALRHTPPTTNAGGFKGFEVFRDIPGIGERHGSLHDIRQAFTIWQNELEAWSLRNDQQRTRRRWALPGSGMTFLDGVLVDKETGEVVDDQ